MRFLITAGIHDDADPNAHDMPDAALMDAYMRFNEDMALAGVLVASEGLNPTTRRARVENRGGKRVVVDGPYSEAKELLGGFYLIEVPTRDEAIAWALRCPVGMASADVLEIFPLTGADDLPPEVVAHITKIAPTWSASFTAEQRGSTGSR